MDEEIIKKDNNNLDKEEVSDEPLDFEYTEDGAEDFKKKLEKLKENLKNCRKEKEDYLNGWQKERAEFANYRKQEENRKTMFSESMRERILVRFLTVLDSFDMAFADKATWQKVDENWRKGIEYIYAQMNTVFEEYGVKNIGEEGEIFDPNFHQSMEMIETNKKEDDHKVASVIQKGYKLGERILRPAHVNVFEYKEALK